MKDLFSLNANKSNIPWYEHAFSGKEDIELDMTQMGMFKKAIYEKKTFRTADLSTVLSFEDFSKIVEEKGYYLVYYYSSEDQDIETSSYDDPDVVGEIPRIRSFFVHESGDAALTYNNAKSYTEVTRYISISTTDAEKTKWFKETFSYHKQPKKIDDKNYVSMMVSSKDGIKIVKTGRVGCRFNEKFYSKHVKKTYEFIVSEFKNDLPKGKITILSGCPGTGKTFFIRSLIHEAGKKASFIIVPPSLVKKLGEPDMLPSLLEHKREVIPTILILEDADILVKERLRESIDAISSALNMSDGILGDVCNIRLLITTNQPINEVDEAMKRPGRLSTSCIIGELNKEEIEIAWKEVSGCKEMPDGLSCRESATIAEIFRFNQ